MYLYSVIPLPIACYIEIDGCLFNNTCWRNPLTDESLCEDVPGSSLGSHSTGVEIHCGDCPHGMTGNGDTRDGLGCVGKGGQFLFSAARLELKGLIIPVFLARVEYQYVVTTASAS